MFVSEVFSKAINCFEENYKKEILATLRN